MAITMHVYYTGEGLNAHKFVDELLCSGVVDKIRARKGNLKYEYFLPMNDPQTVLLIDRWENQEALEEHHQSIAMNYIVELREKYDLHMRVERYIDDPEGLQETDEAFIRK